MRSREEETFNHLPDEQTSLLKQIAETNEQEKMRYFISVSGFFYDSRYELLKWG